MIHILYRPNSEHDARVSGYVREYHARTGRDIELVSLDTKEGAEMARLYGVVDYPAVLAVQPDGQLGHLWQGTMLPLIDEVSSFDSRAW